MARRRLRRLVTRRRTGIACVGLQLVFLTLLVVSTQAAIHLPAYGSLDEPGFSITVVRGRIEAEIVTFATPMIPMRREEPAWLRPLDDVELDLGFTLFWSEGSRMGVTYGKWIEIGIPLWFVMLVSATPAILIWWRTRRVPPGLCRNCRYDLAGLKEGAVCPECGKPTEREA